MPRIRARSIDRLGGLGAAVATLAWPSMTALVLLVMIGVRAIFIGVTQVAAAIELRRVIDNEWLLASSGLRSVAFGVLVLAFPGAGALAVLWMIGAYAVVLGVVLVALGFRLHRLVGTWTREHA